IVSTIPLRPHAARAPEYGINAPRVGTHVKSKLTAERLIGFGRRWVTAGIAVVERLELHAVLRVECDLQYLLVGQVRRVRCAVAVGVHWRSGFPRGDAVGEDIRVDRLDLRLTVRDLGGAHFEYLRPVTVTKRLSS